MIANRQLDETIAAWLEATGPQRMPERVLESTFARTRTSRQHRGWRRFVMGRATQRFSAAFAGAAIVVTAAIVVLNTLQRTSTGGPPAATPSPTADGSLPTGSFRLWRGQGGGEIRVTIPATGWFGTPGAGMLIKNSDPAHPDAGGVVVFAASSELSGEEGLYVYGDACHWSTTKPAQPITTEVEAVTALAAQATSDASAPGDITVGGRAGKSITLRFSKDLDLRGCDQGQLRLLIEAPDSPRDLEVVDATDELWVVDTGGGAGLVIFDLIYDDQMPASFIDELRSMVGSATFN
jgi:hypothetical protein